MARQRTGTVIRTKSGLWQAIVTLADGSRKRMPPFAKGTSKALAQERAAYWSEEAQRRGTSLSRLVADLFRSLTAVRDRGGEHSVVHGVGKRLLGAAGGRVGFGAEHAIQGPGKEGSGGEC